MSGLNISIEASDFGYNPTTPIQEQINGWSIFGTYY